MGEAEPLVLWSCSSPWALPSYRRSKDGSKSLIKNNKWHSYHTKNSETCSSQQRTGQRPNTFHIHRKCNYESDIFFSYFWSLKKKDSVILYMYIICIEYIPVTHAQNCSSSHPVAVSWPVGSPSHYQVLWIGLCLVILFPMGVGGRDALYSPKSSKSSCLSIWIMRLQEWTPTPRSLRCLCKAEDYSYLDKLHSLNVNYVLISGFPDLSRFSLNHTYGSTYLKLLNLLKATTAQWQELACGIPPSLAADPWALALLFLSGFKARSLKLSFGFFLQFFNAVISFLSKSHISN